VGQQLAEHAALTHPPGDELGVLAAVVQDDDLVDRGRAVDGRRLVGELRGRGRRGDEMVVQEVPGSPAYAWARAGVFSAAAAGAGPLTAAAAPREPMPTPWEDCSCLPSVCRAGAIISSARLNPAMSL
jgi:hypothetical protein